MDLGKVIPARGLVVLVRQVRVAAELRGRGRTNKSSSPTRSNRQNGVVQSVRMFWSQAHLGPKSALS